VGSNPVLRTLQGVQADALRLSGPPFEQPIQMSAKQVHKPRKDEALGGNDPQRLTATCSA